MISANPESWADRLAAVEAVLDGLQRARNSGGAPPPLPPTTQSRPTAVLETSAAGIDLIARFEGFRAAVYICAGGYPTIGYGHVVRSGEQFDTLSEPEARRLLRADVVVAERAVRRCITAPLRQGQFDALVSFTFNLGGGSLQRSTLRRKVNRGEHAAVPDEFRRWVWAGGRKLKGLVRRREAEVEMYRAAELGTV